MRNDSMVADGLYIKRVLLALGDFLFFSLYSFSCIAKQVTTLKQFRLMSCLDSLETNLEFLAPLLIHYCYQYHLRSIPSVTTAVTVPDELGASVADVIGIVISTIGKSSSLSPSSCASAITCSLPPLARPSVDCALMPSAVLIAPEVGPAVCMVEHAGSRRLHFCASLVAFACIVHQLLNDIWFLL
jgi:hypothetical protein